MFSREAGTDIGTGDIRQSFSTCREDGTGGPQTELNI